MKNKWIATLVTIFVYSVAMMAFSSVQTLVTGDVAGNQFNNSNAAYFESSSTMMMFKIFELAIFFVTLFTLYRIWKGNIEAFFKAIMAGAIVFAVSGAVADRAWAYADSADKTEAYTILPNQSAFWVPDVGANKDDQKQFESEAYYAERKIASKRFVIPHTKLGGSGGFLGWDFYVPTGRLYIVDRTPYSREWVRSSSRGTSNRDESFPCQSKEGLNITAVVSIGTSVAEENAAKFLYNFGVTPPKGSPTDPQVIFTSVYYGRSLQEVMDDVGRKKVQTLVCNEIGRRTFDEANTDMVPIMNAVEKATKDYFASVGITLNFIGWADTFIFDSDIQYAVNQKYEAEKLASAIPILQQVAQLRVQAGLGKGLENHGLPVVVTPGMMDALEHLVVQTTGAPK